MVNISDNELDISPNFTMEDIYKIRERNYQKFKDSPIEDWIAHINKTADRLRKESGRMYEVTENGMYFYPKRKI